MIDIDKVKAAFAVNPSFCQGKFYKDSNGGSPAALCAMSALVAYAGMHPDLIGKFTRSEESFASFALPVLDVEFGIPEAIGRAIPDAFDDEENEWKGIAAVIKMFEEYNARPVVQAPREFFTWLPLSTYSFSAWAALGWPEQPVADKWESFAPGTATTLTVDEGGVTLDLVAQFLGTSHVQHPAEALIDRLGVSSAPMLHTGLISPDRQILTHAIVPVAAERI